MDETTETPSVPTATLRRRAFAGLWRLVDHTVDEAIAGPKDEVLHDLPAAFVEIGAGRGANFRRYAPGTAVTVFEPNSFMHHALEEHAAEHGLELHAHVSDLRDAQLPEGSVDAVVSTMTLCSVPDRADLVAEILRVLRPGGRFHFVEHVAEPEGSRRRTAQRVVRPLWKALIDHCDLCADTDEVIAAAGFSDVDARTRRIGPSLDLAARIHHGIATR